MIYEEYNIIKDYKDIDKIKWLDFIKGLPDNNIFQSPLMYELYLQADNHEPFIIIIVHEDKIVGLLSGVMINNGFGIEKYMSRRAIVWGGPLIIKNEELRIKKIITKKLLSAFDDYIKKKVIYTEFRNLFDLSGYKDIFLEMGYRYEEHLNFIIDLTLSEEELWKNLNQKRRNAIRKAVNNNLIIEETTNENYLEESYKIIENIYLKAKLPYPGLDFFKNTLRFLTSEHFKIFSAFFEGRIVGTLYVLCYNDIIFGWFSGSYSEYNSKYPNCLILWEVFKWGQKHGYKKYDFGGGGKPHINYGVREFKKKFGGKMVNFGRYKKINSKFLYKIGEIGIKYFGKIGIIIHNIFNNK